MTAMAQWGTLVLLFAATLGLRTLRIDDDYVQRRRNSDVRDLIRSPGKDQMRAMAMQHHLAMADVFWLSAVQEIGRFIEKKQPNVVRLKNWAQLATDLDPRYHHVYYGVATNLTVYNKDADGSDRLLRKGWKNLPNRWQYPFMLGYNAYFLRAQLRVASAFWAKAAYMPEVPRFVPSLAARSRFQAGDDVEAESLLLTMIEHLQGQHRRDAEIRLKILRSEPILVAYDKACAAYLEETGQRPASAEELRMAGLVRYPPVDLFDEKIELDEECRARTAMIVVREDEAAKRAGSHAGEVEPVVPPGQPVDGESAGEVSQTTAVDQQ